MNIKNKHAINTLLLAVCLTSLAACGGGEDGDTTPPPPAQTFVIGGSVSGLAGTGLVLRNGTENLNVQANGSFTFTGRVANGASYSVTVSTQPSSPAQLCTVTNGAGTANANVGNVIVNCTVASALDTDGDGLPDDEEIAVHRTSPLLRDTDGDGYSDYRELVELGFAPGVNNLRYNPLIADLPKLRIAVQTTPIIGAQIATSSTSTETLSTSRSQSQSTSTATTYGTSTTVGVETSVSTTVGGSLLGGPSAEVTTSVSVSTESTVSFDRTNTSENQTAWERMQARGVEEATSFLGGFIRVGLQLSNDGHIPFTLNAVTLSATQASDGVSPFTPVGTLDYDSTQAFQPLSLSAGQSTGALVFEKNDLDLGTLRTLLTAARSMTVDVSTLDVRDGAGRAFAYTEEEVTARTAKILIDYGPYAPAELYQVATNNIPGSPGHSLEELLGEYLQIPFTSSAAGVGSIRALSSPTGRWVVTRKRNIGTGLQVDISDPLQTPFSLQGIEARAGDEILFVLLEDADADGVGYREELIHGTDPDLADSDADGLSDFQEIREGWLVTAINIREPDRYPVRVFSSPIHADYDGDGVLDAEERQRGLDPYNADTDGDDIRDDIDTVNGLEPLVPSVLIQSGKRTGDTSVFNVHVSGYIGAALPDRVVSRATIDWESDGAPDLEFNTLSGGNPTRSIQGTNTYAGVGSYDILLHAVDDSAPANSLQLAARAVFTEPLRAHAGDFGWNTGWRLASTIRQVADLNQDGYDDLVMIGGFDTWVMLGSPNGPQPRVRWDVGNWGTSRYGNVDTDPRFFVDLDSDGDLDIVGVDASDNLVRHALNNGAGFDAPVDWITGIGWHGSLDSAFMVDVDGNGYPDFVHARSGGRLMVHTTNGALLATSVYVGDAWPTGYPDRRLFPMEAADLDGDGCVDLVMFGTSATLVARSGCNGRFSSWEVLANDFGRDQGWRNEFHKRWVDDINNDGLPDLVAAGASKLLVWINHSQPGTLRMEPRGTWTGDFTSARGWVNDRPPSSALNPVTEINVTPRYLADVNGDGFKDIVGFANGGVAVGINMLDIDQTSAFAEGTVVTTEFSIGSADWWENFSCPGVSCSREHFPRMVGDVDGDGRADMVGFDQTGVIFQSMPYVIQFR